MVIDYKKIIIKLLNKSSRNQATKRDIDKLDRLNKWYFTTLK